MRTLLSICGLLLVLSKLSNAGCDTQPHILFIVADDLGWSDVGINNEHVISPNINQLANDGVTLTQAYVHPRCSPTRTALLTGYYAHRMGMQHKTVNKFQPKGMPLNGTTIASELRDLGYSTYMVGKWHLGFCNHKYTPHGRGFDYFYGFYAGLVDYYTHMSDDFLDLSENDFPDRSEESNGKYSSELFADKATEYIQKHANCQTCRPMFMYLPFLSVHTPLQPPQEYLDLYPYVQDQTRRAKLAMVTALDDAVGRVVQAMKDNNLWDNTVLIFSTDNGAPIPEGGNNWPLRGAKSSCFEGGTRAVSFVNSNRLEKTGYNNSQMIHVVDWFPTLIHLANGQLDPARDHDGYNVWDAISKNATSPRTGFVYHIDELHDQWGIREGDYKAMHGKLGGLANWFVTPPEANLTIEIPVEQVPSDANLLFNLKDDPTEQHDLAAIEPDKLAELMAKLDEYRAKLMPAWSPPGNYSAGDPTKLCDRLSYGWCDAKY